VDEAGKARRLGEHFAAEPNHECAAAEVVHIRRDLAEPADKSFRLLRYGFAPESGV
jgi:hypothetical protein